MNKSIITVPKGVRFISEWYGFLLPDHPCIIDKKLPGCGFTEYCIRGHENVILCSPRKILLENKEKQHRKEVYYVKNELEQELPMDKDLEKKVISGAGNNPTTIPNLTSEDIKKKIINNIRVQLINYINDCKLNSRPIKLLVTYDSFRLIKDILGEDINNFFVVIDEFQSIFIDAKFKSDTELAFVYHLQNLNKVVFVSATPMMDEYLDELDEFKNLPYYVFDWESEEPFRVKSPEISHVYSRSINDPAYIIINEYLEGNFESTVVKVSGEYKVVYSTEVVFYVNSVANIINIIHKAGLTPEQCNILIAKTPENEKKLKNKLGTHWKIGKVPLLGEPHKMFTFCTRTVYLGADFYSTCARTVVLSDANVDTMAVDISLDLPQILGRQRLDDNPWKNRALLFYKTSRQKMLEQNRDAYIDVKVKRTLGLLENYNNAPNKDLCVEKYEKDVIASNYKDDYVSVCRHSGKNVYPVFNKLVMISEKRCFDIQKYDYCDRSSVNCALTNNGFVGTQRLTDILWKLKSTSNLSNKLKIICEAGLNEIELDYIFDQNDVRLKRYYCVVGSERCRALGYHITKIEEEYQMSIKTDISILDKYIYSEFQEGEIYSRKKIKEILGEIYDKADYKKTPKATDLGNYFEISEVKLKGDRGFKIIKKI